MNEHATGHPRLFADLRRGIPAKAAIPLAIIFVVLLLDLVYVSTPGWVWDETYYYSFSTAVRKWLAHPTLDETVINATFREGNAHPPLPLYVMAVTGGLFQAQLGDFLLSVRLATAVQFAALVVVTYLFVKRAAGLEAAVFATVLTALSPRLFAHSLMATYDVPMCLTWMGATAAFYLGMSSRRWAVASGFIFGLALLTKVNAFLLPLALWPWGIYFHRRKSIPAIVSMCLAGPAVLFAGWPWLWLHPARNLAEYIADKFPPGVLPAWLLSWTGTGAVAWRETARTLYFGAADARGVPWHYPFVMFVFTMPLATLAGCAASALAARREGQSRPFLALVWWSIFVQLAVFALVMKPFDGVRLFLPVLPLAAVAAGVGLRRLRARGRAAAAAVVLVAVLSPGAEFFVYEPYGMSYFMPLVGGVPGAERMGMEVTYYGEAVDPAGFASINERAVEGQSVAYAPMFKKLPLLMPHHYIKYGYLKLGLKSAAPSDDWDYLIFVNRGGSIDPSDVSNLARGRTIHENRLLGVMLSKTLARNRIEEGGGDAPGQP